jgi:hypothetical protein
MALEVKLLLNSLDVNRLFLVLKIHGLWGKHLSHIFNLENKEILAEIRLFSLYKQTKMTGLPTSHLQTLKLPAIQKLIAIKYFTQI